MSAQDRMMTCLEWHDTMIEQPGASAPHDDIAVFYRYSHRPVCSMVSAQLEHSRNTQRDRDYRRAEIPFVLILM